jgi:hypothetical protein
LNPRDTTTGRVLEEMALSGLTKGGYTYRKQVVIGQRPGGGKHKVDLLVNAPDAEQIPVSMKWQQVSGTAEQKVPFEIICLADAVHKSQGKFKKAYVVLGGEGWTLREYYVGGEIQRYLQNCEQVEVVSFETFVSKANQGKL